MITRVRVLAKLALSLALIAVLLIGAAMQVEFVYTGF